jgi:hypothetical protein
MNEKKLAAIKAAYGDLWEEVKEDINNEGWCDSRQSKFTGEVDEYGYGWWRPKSLNGLEDNNGWTLFSEKVPEQNTLIDLWTKTGHITRSFRYSIQTEPFVKENYSHWRPFDPKQVLRASEDTLPYPEE